MKYSVLVISLALLANNLSAQVMQDSEDSLRAILDNGPKDTSRIVVLLKLSESYAFKEPDSSLSYANAAFAISRRLKYDSGIVASLRWAGSATRYRGDLTGALKNLFEAPFGHSKVLISVKDNGDGIPALIKEKIFQPFFTTKPTGQGTGLGLSLSYDIIKAHGGELKAQPVQEGAEFIIILPVRQWD